MKTIRDYIGLILNCECLTESELKDFTKILIQQGYEEGYKQCKIDYNIKDEPSVTPKRQELNVDKIVLFLKADRGLNVLEDIRRENKLSSNLSESLFEVTQKLWVGDESSFEDNNNLKKIFNIPGERSDFGPEYDAIAVLVNLALPIRAKLSDSYEQHEFITEICNSENECVGMSQRLPMYQIEGLELIDL